MEAVPVLLVMREELADGLESPLDVLGHDVDGKGKTAELFREVVSRQGLVLAGVRLVEDLEDEGGTFVRREGRNLYRRRRDRFGEELAPASDENIASARLWHVRPQD